MSSTPLRSDGNQTVLIGQRQIETILARQIARERAGHAYLFLGAPGSGKTTAARLFAQALNCERQPAAGPGEGEGWRLKPCGRCESCRRILADTHPEVLTVLPGSKTGQDITIEQAREIRRNAALTPKLGRSRVYIIPQAETFNEASANALLKTLEEPSPFITLILCAPSPSQVLPTIRSRCQVLRFGLAAPAEVAEGLRARGMDADQAETLSRICGGRPGLAITWAESPGLLQHRRSVQELVGRAVAAQARAARDPSVGIAALRLAEQLRILAGSEKEDGDGPARPAKVVHSENLELALDFLRDLLLLTEGAPPLLLRNQDQLSQLEELASGTTPERVLADIRAVREAQQILDRNVSPQLVLERMFWAVVAGPLPQSAGLFEETVI